MMPEMDGFEVAKCMRQNAFTRDMPILFVTAIAKDLKQINEGYSLGCVDYMLKPLEPEVVRAKVAVFVELFRKRKENQRQSELIRNSERIQFLKLERAARLKAEGAEQRFRNLVNALDHAIIWEAEPDLSQFTFISERVEGILGYRRDQWLSEPNFFMNHVLDIDRPRVLQCLSKLSQARTNWDHLGERCEHRMICANGTVRWLHTGLQDERDRDGKMIRLRGLCIDISPLKSVEEKLREVIQAKDEIVSAVAHDIRTPLSAADLRTSLLKMASEKEDLGEVNRQVNRVKHAIRHTLRITDNILDVEKITSGNLDIVLSEEFAGSLIDEAVDMLRPLANEKSIQLHSESNVNFLVNCDRERALQVFSNLIGNAIKYCAQNGEIWVRGTQEGTDARFSVQDNGPGIPTDQLPHIFARYWRSNKGRGQGGLGLGLTISKGIVEAHGGKIWATSQEGHGSAFFFTLPLVSSKRVAP